MQEGFAGEDERQKAHQVSDVTDTAGTDTAGTDTAGTDTAGTASESDVVITEGGITDVTGTVALGGSSDVGGTGNAAATADIGASTGAAGIATSGAATETDDALTNYILTGESISSAAEDTSAGADEDLNAPATPAAASDSDETTT